MKPTILKVFSNYPDTITASFNQKKIHTDNENHLIRISNMENSNSNNNNHHHHSHINRQIKCEFLSADYCDNNSFSLDDNFIDSNESQKDFNVLEDYYRFQERRNAFIDSRKSVLQTNPPNNVHEKHVYERPNFSYTQLIYMAIESSAMKALTVNDIYTWCEIHFPYYAHAIHGWKNSLRHNLSINKCFKKITKIGQGGRGSLWIVDPRERQHLVSTMHRSNLGSIGAAAAASIIIHASGALRPPQIIDNQSAIQYDESDIQIDSSNEPDNIDDNDVSIGEEKPVFSWTDTRLPCGDYQPGLSPDNRSHESDTDYNDWNRAMLSLEPIFPVKLHPTQSESQCDSPYPTVTPPPPRSRDHIYSIPDIATVINDPYSVVRHTFQPPVDPVSNAVSYCTSSDYNDEEWPRTPSPIIAVTHTPDQHQNQSLVISKKSNLKRGRPKTNNNNNIIKSMKPPINRNDRINNMFDMNNFINSL